MTVYGRKKTGFKNSRCMRFWAHSNLAKSDQAKGTLMKVYERQKVFLEVVVVDYLSSLLFLDYILEGSNLETMREMILSIKSTNFSNLLLFYLVDRT